MFAAHWFQDVWSWGTQALDALVFPWVCPLCGDSALGSPFCGICRHSLLTASGPVCARCAMPLGPWADQTRGCSECRGRPLGFDAAIALGPYQGPIRDLCLRLKHESNAWLAPWLADLLVEAHPSLRGLSADVCVVPIPLHWQRRWTRGYNQADALATGLARRLAVPRVSALRRVVKTPQLAQNSRTERADIMRYAFRARPRANVKGRTVLLVDDILTTGATCGAAARALKQAGAARVVTAVIGRAEGSPPR